MTKLVEIEGIGAAYSAKLEAVGIMTLADLMDKGASKKGRVEIAKQTEISEKLVLNWVNRADLSRIKGVSTQYADLLEFSGVDTVPELAQRNAENLHVKMTEVNDERALVRQLPALTQVQAWVAHAKELPRVINH
ncbi:DUF4332 domain-containing protein [Shewanella violacea]|nr:DUF4332 domain-containing protein [Shewanella violacea]